MPESQIARSACRSLALPVLSTGALVHFPNADLPPQVTIEDLVTHAEVLAREFGYDPASAGAAELEWYQERVGREICSLRRANNLRSLVLLRGREQQLPEQQRAFRGLTPPGPRSGEGLNALGMVGILFAIIFIGSLITDAPQPGDADYPPADVPSLTSPAAYGFPVPADRDGR